MMLAINASRSFLVVRENAVKAVRAAFTARSISAALPRLDATRDFFGRRVDHIEQVRRDGSTHSPLI